MTGKAPTSKRRLLLLSLSLGSLAGLLAIVTLSPLAFTALLNFKLNWERLSVIGQTYGAVSALLSSLAIGGVAISLLYQARDSLTAREHAIGALHQELLKMAISDTSLLDATGAPWDLPLPSEAEPIRQYLYVQIWVSLLARQYTIGGTSESAIRSVAKHELFRSSMGRNYWEMTGKRQLKTTEGRRNKFFRILDDEYKKVVASGVPAADPIKKRPAELESGPILTFRPLRNRQFQVVAAALALGILTGRLWHRIKPSP